MLACPQRVRLTPTTELFQGVLHRRRTAAFVSSFSLTTTCSWAREVYHRLEQGAEETERQRALVFSVVIFFVSKEPKSTQYLTKRTGISRFSAPSTCTPCKRQYQPRSSLTGASTSAAEKAGFLRGGFHFGEVIGRCLDFESPPTRNHALHAICA